MRRQYLANGGGYRSRGNEEPGRDRHDEERRDAAAAVSVSAARRSDDAEASLERPGDVRLSCRVDLDVLRQLRERLPVALDGIGAVEASVAPVREHARTARLRGTGGPGDRERHEAQGHDSEQATASLAHG